ncbi:hypothetical protein DOY81_013222, partial [Sarcophaga bullata]
MLFSLENGDWYHSENYHKSQLINEFRTKNYTLTKTNETHFSGLAICCALGYTQAQLGLGAGFGLGPKTGFGGLSPGQFFQTIVLEAEAGKLLTRPDLPEDLRQRVL